MLDNNRMKHSVGVGKKMKKLAGEISPGDKDFEQDMFLLGLLHDIGYEFSSEQDEHAQTGGNALRMNGYKYWKEIFYHGKPNAEYSSEALKILNIADLLTDAQGNEVSAKDRLLDVMGRYGKDSTQYKEFEKLAKEVKLM